VSAGEFKCIAVSGQQLDRIGEHRRRPMIPKRSQTTLGVALVPPESIRFAQGAIVWVRLSNLRFRRFFSAVAHN
jgi:hypothetical protein